MIWRFSAGGLACVVISDGQPVPPWEPPLGMFFTPETGVPESELAGALASEGQNRTTTTAAYNCLCVETSAGLAVIDSGLGPSFLGYGPDIGAQVGKFGDRLVEAGFAPGDVAAVVFTHLHQDHVRGAIWSGRPTFGDAIGFAHEAEISFWQNHAASLEDRAHTESAREVIRLFGDRFRGFDYGVEILPQVRTVDAAGHTPGHAAMVLGSGPERVLCLGDCFHDRLQLSHPGWCTPWDIDPERAVRARRALLALAADEELLVHAYHMPFPGLGRVRRHGEVFAWLATPEPR
jgi:glyoxylase-like metal-dependent hydrolase (beta-lactamase superfamily II)